MSKGVNTIIIILLLLIIVILIGGFAAVLISNQNLVKNNTNTTTSAPVTLTTTTTVSVDALAGDKAYQVVKDLFTWDQVKPTNFTFDWRFSAQNIRPLNGYKLVATGGDANLRYQKLETTLKENGWVASLDNDAGGVGTVISGFQKDTTVILVNMETPNKLTVMWADYDAK